MYLFLYKSLFTSNSGSNRKKSNAQIQKENDNRKKIAKYKYRLPFLHLRNQSTDRPCHRDGRLHADRQAVPPEDWWRTDESTGPVCLGQPHLLTHTHTDNTRTLLTKLTWKGRGRRGRGNVEEEWGEGNGRTGDVLVYQLDQCVQVNLISWHTHTQYSTDYRLGEEGRDRWIMHKNFANYVQRF